MILKTALALKFFYFATYYLMITTNSASNLMLRGFGIRASGVPLPPRKRIRGKWQSE